MRLPWIQVDKAGIAQCRLLARLLLIPEAQGIGIGMMLWEWALEIAPDGDFSGVVPDAELLAAALMWPVDDAPRLLAQLQRVGMVATHPQLRVRGLDRYRAAWEKNQRRNGKSLESGGGVPATGDNPPGTARKTETETETDKLQKQKTAGEKPPAAPFDLQSPPSKPKKTKPEKTTDTRHAPLVAVLVDGFETLRGTAYPFKARDAAAVRDLLAVAEPDAIAQAWARALRHGGFPTVSSLPELHQHFAHFVGTGPPPPKPRSPEFDPNQGIIRTAASREDPFPWTR